MSPALSTPVLSGFDQYCEWRRTILHLAAFHGCARHLTTSVPEPYRYRLPADDPDYAFFYPKDEFGGQNPPTAAQRVAPVKHDGITTGAPAVASSQNGTMGASASYGVLSPSEQDVWDKWAEREGRARCLLFNSIEPLLYNSLSGGGLWTAHDLFAYLEATFGAVTDETRTHAVDRLKRVRMMIFNAKRVDYTTHLRDFKRVLAEVLDMGAANDARVCAIFLESIADYDEVGGYVRYAFRNLPNAARRWDGLEQMYLDYVERSCCPTEV